MRHLKFSLCLFAPSKESLDYTALIGAPPQVQPMFVYTSVMGVPPKVQPMFVYTALMDVPPKVQPMFVYTALMGVPPKLIKCSLCLLVKHLPDCKCS